MNIRDLAVFNTVAREKSLTKASKFLYMTPQGVSKVIKNLESEYGCELFARTQGRMELTESGECFLSYAQSMSAEHHQMRMDLLAIKQKQKGVVNLLSAYGILRLVTPECIEVFRKEHPEIEFNYAEYPDCQVERRFMEREGNVAFTIGRVDESLYDVYDLEQFPIMLLVNKNHPLARQKTVSINEIRNQPLYIESEEFKIYHQIVGRCQEAGFEPNIKFQTSGFSLCTKMVKANKGISVIVDFVFDDMSGGELVAIPFVDGPCEWNSWKARMILPKGEEMSPEVKLFADHVKSWMVKIKRGEISRV